MPLPRKARLFWPLLAVLFLADCTTKQLAVEHLGRGSGSHAVLGDWLRLTLVYNPGGAMGLTLGPLSRVAFAAAALVALVVLYRVYRRAPEAASTWAAGLALVMAGAAGNLIDRLRSSAGVVDFIDVGVGSWRFWTFNLADAWIALGAGILAALVWREQPRDDALPSRGDPPSPAVSS